MGSWAKAPGQCGAQPAGFNEREAEAVEAIPTDPDRNPSATPLGEWAAAGRLAACARLWRGKRVGSGVVSFRTCTPHGLPLLRTLDERKVSLTPLSSLSNALDPSELTEHLLSIRNAGSSAGISNSTGET